jgi:hypothetical protein
MKELDEIQTLSNRDVIVFLQEDIPIDNKLIHMQCI